jgi:hypothetical protein
MSSSDEIEQDGQQEAAAEDGASYDDAADAGGETAYIGGESRQPLSKGTVAMFVLLAVAGAGTYFMYVRTGPQSAAAASDPKAQQVIKQYMTDRDKNLFAMEKMLRDTKGFVEQFLNYPSVKQIPLSALSANPFRVTAATSDTPGPADDQRDKKRREEERLAILKSVNGLQLQSVMHSDSRKSCMVNNTLYLEGQQVESFTIEKISPNSVIVRNGSYRFELRMQR